MYNYKESAEYELIRRAKRGDTKAFSELYSRIYKDLYKFALYMTKHPQDAEDAVSETVISAFETISGLKKDSSFKCWIFTILNNKCKKALRLEKRKLESEAGAISEGKDSGSCNPDYAQWHDVRRAFDKLDDEEQRIIAFSVFGGYQSDEIAQMLGKNAATVRSRKYRAFEKMRAFIN